MEESDPSLDEIYSKLIKEILAEKRDKITVCHGCLRIWNLAATTKNCPLCDSENLEIINK